MGGLLVAVALAGCSAERPADGEGTTGGSSASAPAAELQDTLRVLAYNIHHGEGMDEVVDLQRIADLILALDPDVVTLQEVDSVVDRTVRVDQAERLGGLTGMTVAFGRFMPYQGGAYGMAVLSRWPVQEVQNWRLPDGVEPRSALGVRVRSPTTARDVWVVGIHFYASEEERLAQATALESILSDVALPVVLAGDFNSLPDSPVLSRFGGEWRRLAKGDDRLTFPSYQPEVEIDHVLVRAPAGFEAVEHNPLDEPVVSDHRPLITTLVFPAAPASTEEAGR